MSPSRKVLIGLALVLGVYAFGLLRYARASAAATASEEEMSTTTMIPAVRSKVIHSISTSRPNVSTSTPVCKTAEFAPAHAAETRFNMAIFVFAWRRHASLRRLVDSLLSAEYCGAQNVSLTFLLDAGASPSVEAYVRGINWAHGRKRVVINTEAPRGIRGMWIDVLARELEQHEPPDAHLLPLEDDVEVSPLYYWWLRRAARAYGPFHSAAGTPQDPRLVGVSLYAPRLNEIEYPSKWLKPRNKWLAGSSPAFLFELPCSWGALFFRDTWMHFLQFYRVRGAKPFYDAAQEATQKGKLKDREVLGDPLLAIANSRASTWPRSWKRFMIDYMHGRGDYMLYPNAPIDEAAPFASLSFSTTYMERGDHSGTDGKIEADKTDALRPAKEHDKRKTVPLVQAETISEALLAFDRIPRLSELPVISMFHKRLKRSNDLVARGSDFVYNAVKNGNWASKDQYKALAELWLGKRRSSTPATVE